MKLLIAGGGTGGHVFPALAIAREWLARGKEKEVVLVGTQRGIEMKLVPQAGLPLETLRVAGLKGKGCPKIFEALVCRIGTWQHSDHRVWFTVQPDRLADDRPVSRKLVLPEPVTDDSDFLFAQLVFVRSERSA